MKYLTKILILFTIITVSNLLIELTFEKNIENLINLKFLISSLIASLIGGFILRVSFNTDN